MNPPEKTVVPEEFAARWQEVCTLSEEELRERSQLFRTQLMQHVRKQERLANGMAFEFDASAERRAQLEELIALERQCCGPMKFELSESEAGLRLEVLAPPKPRRWAWRGVVRSAGVGAVGSFLLFCGLPLALVYVVGAEAVAPLLGLDDPWIVAAGAVVLGGGLLFRERRRATR